VGGSAIDSKVVESLISRSRREDSPLDVLTPREHELLAEMAKGKNTAAIRRVARHHRAIGREVDSLDLPEA
jgi:hypothetical protein